MRLFVAYLAGLPGRLRYWFVVHRRRPGGSPCKTVHVWVWDVARFARGEAPFVTFHCLHCSAVAVGDRLPTSAEQTRAP